MDTIHNWALWRLLFIALIALPFLVAAVAVGFREQRGKAENASAENGSGRVSPPIAGPDAWQLAVERRVEIPAQIERQHAA
jgi:hypothetical protein